MEKKVKRKFRLPRFLKIILLWWLFMLVLILILFFAGVKRAGAEATNSERPARGYFFYEDPAKQDEQEKPVAREPEKPREVVKEEPKPEFEFPVLDTAPPAMKKWLKEPNEANATEYLAWQYKYFQHLKKLSYSLSDAYLKHGGEVYPMPYSTTGPMGSVYYQSVQNNIYKTVLGSFVDKIGLVYFYTKDTPGYQHQSDIVARFKQKYGFSMRGVAIDGDIDEDLPFFSSVNPDLVRSVGVTQKPALYAVLDRNGEPVIGALSAGFTGFELIEQRLIKFLINENVISERDLNPNYLR